MDTLSDALEDLRLESVVHGSFDLSAPWGFRVGQGRASFYVVTQGLCRLEVGGVSGAVQLAGGDYAVLPQGHAHVLQSGRDAPTVPLTEVLVSQAWDARQCQPGRLVRYGGGGDRTTLVGGCFELEEGRRRPFATALPPVIHVRADGGAAARWLETSLELVAAEAAGRQPGAQTVIGRLADILFIQAVRWHLAHGVHGDEAWLRALVDPQISDALSLIHQKPEDLWTVESLASRVGMSRSAFAVRFARLVGEPPLAYVTHWRMQKAARLLRRSQASLGEVAARIGYETEAAFNKAFKRAMGVTPGAYRRALASPPLGGASARGLA